MNEKILELGKKGLRLIAYERESASFLGGKPLVGSAFDWPRKNKKPLAFIAQLDLGEINNDQVINWLPQNGRLLFFYDLEEWPWGFDPNDKGGWAVIYDRSAGDLRFQESPSDQIMEHPASKVKYISSEQFVSYPDAQRINYAEVGLSEKDDDDYYEFIEGVYGESPRHQVGGFPSPVQNDEMEDECQMVSGGVNCGGPDGYKSEEAKQLRTQNNDWRLLLQFDSDDDVDAMWGDLGMLYFWVRESDAKNLDFSNCWLILQCG
jgi:uncharacterized protein YwqG